MRKGSSWYYGWKRPDEYPPVVMMNMSGTVVGTMPVVVGFPFVIADVSPVNDDATVAAVSTEAFAAILVFIIVPVVMLGVLDVAEAIPKTFAATR